MLAYWDLEHLFASVYEDLLENCCRPNADQVVSIIVKINFNTAVTLTTFRLNQDKVNYYFGKPYQFQASLINVGQFRLSLNIRVNSLDLFTYAVLLLDR